MNVSGSGWLCNGTNPPAGIMPSNTQEDVSSSAGRGEKAYDRTQHIHHLQPIGLNEMGKIRLERLRVTLVGHARLP